MHSNQNKSTMKLLLVILCLITSSLLFAQDLVLTQDKKGRWGVNDLNRKKVIPCKYDKMELIVNFNNQVILIKVQLNDTSYFIDRNDDLVDPELVKFKKDNKIGFGIMTNGMITVVIPAEYEAISNDFNEGLASVYKNGSWMVIDKTGNLVIPMKKFGYISVFYSNGLIPVCDWAELNKYGSLDGKRGKWGYADKNGNLAIKFQYDLASYFSEERAIVEVGNKFGFINTKGDQIVEPIYDAAYSYHEGLAGVRIGKYQSNLESNWGFIDLSGKVVIPFDFDFVDPEGFKNGKIKVRSNGEFFMIDKTGKRTNDFVSTPEFYSSNENLVVYKNMKGYFGIKNEYGKVFVNATFTSIKKDIVSGVYIAKKESKWQLMSSKGIEITPLKYTNIQSLNYGTFNGQGYFSFQTEESIESPAKWGLMNHEGKEITVPQFESILDKGEDFFAVKINEKWGYININGQKIIDCKYDLANKFSGGEAFVRIGKEHYYIDKTGKRITGKGNQLTNAVLTFDNTNRNYSVFANYDRQVYGLCEEDNLSKVITNAKYSYILPYSPFNDLIIVNNGCSLTQYADLPLGGKYGIVDSQGKELVSPKYDWIGDFYFANSPVVAIGVKQKVVWQEFETLLTYEGKWGAINEKGIEVIPLIHNCVIGYALEISENEFQYYYACNKGGTWKNGIQTEGDVYESYFIEGGNWALFDVQGKQLLNFEFDDINFDNGEINVVKDGKKGIYNSIQNKINW